MKISSSLEHAIRPATTGDAKGIATVHVDTWREAYKDIVPREYLAALDVVTGAERWLKTLTSGTPHVLVAVENGTVVGWIAFGPSRDNNLESRCAEIEAIYVAPPFWKRGIGTALMSAASENLYAKGYSAVTLWVLKDNESAQSFYVQRGFQIDGSAKVIEIGGAWLTEVRLKGSVVV
ncbi:GNAT family N-acetyltransferase [Paraburkholderia sp. J76]|uniref:GNAT family N-acetyltransferase n=1 Tax=Paraburkholderia sp. J76 TaxID=2805439 RepID=UPI002ABDD3C3|nr:GNAT family N-acetyltransferase [Paraburkholderia sp. J76]